jgi:hypothetical protein
VPVNATSVIILSYPFAVVFPNRAVSAIEATDRKWKDGLPPID